MANDAPGIFFKNSHQNDLCLKNKLERIYSCYLGFRTSFEASSATISYISVIKNMYYEFMFTRRKEITSNVPR